MNRRWWTWLALLVAVLALIWMDPWPASKMGEVGMAPVVLPTASRAAVPSTQAALPDPAMAQQNIAPSTPLSASPSSLADNAFEVRGATQAVAMQTPTRARMPRATLPPAPLPPLPTPTFVEPVPPPLQVIGTWQDGRSEPGVFLAAPSGTLLARVGQTLMAEFTVDQITQKELVLKQLSNQKVWRLSIPQAVDRPGLGMGGR